MQRRQTVQMAEGEDAFRAGAIITCSSIDMDYFRLLNDCLREQGLPTYSVTQLSEAEYRVRSRNRGLGKFILRFRMYILYPIQLIVRAFFASSRAVFVVTSNTFYAPLIVASIGLFKRFRTVHLLYDLYPDAIEVSGSATQRHIVSKALGKVATWTQTLCHGTVYLGDFLKAHAEKRWGPSRHGCTIDIGANARLFGAPCQLPMTGPVRIHYGGQLGLMHDAETLIACVRNVLSENVPDVNFSFLVSGAHAQKLRSELAGLPVEIGQAIPPDEWRQCIRSSHVGLVSVSPGGATVCLPSKTYAMLAGGLAIIAICPPWSDLARLVVQHEVGWVISNSPYDESAQLCSADYLARTRARRPEAEITQEFVDVVRRVSADRKDLQRKRQNARRTAATAYSFENIASRWESYLRAVRSS